MSNTNQYTLALGFIHLSLRVTNRFNMFTCPLVGEAAKRKMSIQISSLKFRSPFYHHNLITNGRSSIGKKENDFLDIRFIFANGR